MKVNKISSFFDYQKLMNMYSSKKLYTNDYIQSEVISLIEHNKLYECHTSSNLFFLVEKRLDNNILFYRVYYYIGNTDEIADFSNSINLVVEILYRGDKGYPKDEIDYIIKCGFSINLVRNQYGSMFKDLKPATDVKGIFIEYAQSIGEVEMVCSLFNESFDYLSGDYIPSVMYDELLSNKQILIAKNDAGEFLGGLHLTINKGIAWISHVAVLPEARGHCVGRALLDFYVQNNCTSEKQRYMFWVQQQNKTAINMYEKKGFKYLNKSSISLIKIN